MKMKTGAGQHPFFLFNLSPQAIPINAAFFAAFMLFVDFLHVDSFLLDGSFQP